MGKLKGYGYGVCPNCGRSILDDLAAAAEETDDDE
jgi:hypothetical protein